MNGRRILNCVGIRIDRQVKIDTERIQGTSFCLLTFLAGSKQ